jgi:hypothetical protein
VLAASPSSSAHGCRRPRDPGEPEVRGPRAQRVGRAGHELSATSKGRIFPSSAPTCWVRCRREACARRSRETVIRATRSTSSPSRSLRSAPRRSRSTTCGLVRGLRSRT